MSGIKKNPLSSNTEDLLNILEDDTVEEGLDVKYKNDTLVFLTTFKIESGTTKVKKHTMYNIYKVWSKEPVTKIIFTRELNSFLDSDLNHYKINQSAVTITHAAYKYYSNENFKLKSSYIARQFETFLGFFSIEPGTHYVRLDVLFHLYNKFIERFKIKTKLKIDDFSKYCELNLNKKSTEYGVYYSIDFNDTIKPLIIANETELNNEKEQKKSKQVSGPRRKIKSKNSV